MLFRDDKAVEFSDVTWSQRLLEHMFSLACGGERRRRFGSGVGVGGHGCGVIGVIV